MNGARAPNSWAVDNPEPVSAPLIDTLCPVSTNGAASLRARLGSVMLTLAYGFLFGIPAFAQKPAPQKAAGETLTIDPTEMQKPWTGDLDGMIERRVIRVLTVNSKTFYFNDKGTLRGTVVEFYRIFEDELNKKLAAEKKLKDKNLKVRVFFIPMRRDQLLPALAAGKGDIVSANLTITPERQKLVDFTSASMANVSEIVVSGPASPKIASLDDLSGQEVFVRKSSSYYESLVALNKKFAAAKKAAGQAQGSPRDAGGRGSARDARRRSHRARHR